MILFPSLWYPGRTDEWSGSRRERTISTYRGNAQYFIRVVHLVVGLDIVYSTDQEDKDRPANEEDRGSRERVRQKKWAIRQRHVPPGELGVKYRSCVCGEDLFSAMETRFALTPADTLLGALCEVVSVKLG